MAPRADPLSERTRQDSLTFRFGRYFPCSLIAFPKSRKINEAYSPRLNKVANERSRYIRKFQAIQNQPIHGASSRCKATLKVV
jgi:hypothetical protein